MDFLPAFLHKLDKFGRCLERHLGPLVDSSIADGSNYLLIVFTCIWTTASIDFPEDDSHAVYITSGVVLSFARQILWR
jgi:hypothetical protein